MGTILQECVGGTPEQLETPFVHDTPVEKNPFAVALGRLSRGVAKSYSPEERKRRSDHMRTVNAERLRKLRELKL